MKVLVVGANGKIGRHLIDQLKDHDSITAKAMIRDRSQADYFKDLGVEYVVADVQADVPPLVEAARDCDAIVFTAGSGPHTGKDKTLMVDLDGAVKTMQAARLAHIKRYVMISSFDTSRFAIQAASASFAPYVVAKHYADEALRASNLDYTIIHPGKLNDEAGTGKVTLHGHVDRDEIPREDVASVIVDVLENDTTIGKEFQVVRGDTEISQAVKNFV